jgi:hypothetical protein
MAESRRLVKVFLASPGDLSEERKAAKLVVDEFNALLAEEFGYQVELVGWEDTVSIFGRPQATINRELERCELFVGLMWKHWGTPPDVSGPYTSGFEEEFKISVERRLSDGHPEISLLFKEIVPEFLRDPGDELKKVLAFKSKLIAEKTIYFENFLNTRDFETKFRRCITTYIRNLRAEELAKVSGQSQAPTSESEKQQSEDISGRSIETPLSVEGAKFLREFISKTEHVTEQVPLAGEEIARFRLLSSIVRNHGNDETSLGPHDANLIFNKGSHLKLGHSELRGLVNSGLDNYSHENVPLWRWLAAIDGFSNNTLPYYTFIRTSTISQVNALAAMRLISEPLPPESEFSRDFFFNAWFAKDAASSLRVAALNYLGDCGITSDLTTIRQELDRNDNQTISAAADAFIRINLRESREHAILALYELQPTSIHQDVLSSLFDNEAVLSTEILLGGVGHRNSDVRRKVVELLRERRVLPTEIAEKLLTDNDAVVRCAALKSLVDKGRTFSDADAKKILIKPNPNTGMGLYRFGASDTAGEACWTHFRQLRLCSLKDKELEDIAHEDPIFDPDPLFILANRQFKKRSEELRKAIDDQYKGKFAEWLHSIAEKFAGNVDLLEKTRSLENYMRKELTRKGLDVICNKADPRDLGRVREAIKSGFVDYSASDIEYLRRFGEWEDIPLIIDSLKRPEAGRSGTLLSSSDDSKFKEAARAIYALGRSRLNEALVMKAPSQLLSHLIVETSDKAFSGLSDVSITSLLQSEDDSVRKSASLKCIKSLPKRRVAKLLADYTSGYATHYYNVVHWLDFGVSTPRDMALSAVEKILNKGRKR